MPFENYNALTWINRQFDIPFDETEISDVRDFTMMWNLFEKSVCSSWFKVNKVKSAIENHEINSNCFQEHLNYFRSRYILHQDAVYYFNLLFNSEQNWQREHVGAVLNNQKEENDEIVLACVLIAYRYRNNLFHGNKELRQIHHQRKNLRCGMSVLSTFMDCANCAF